MKSSLKVLMMGMAIAGPGVLADLFPEPALKPERPCLNCGKLKRHNNAFCSGKCCREYDAKPKQEPPCPANP